MTRQTIQSWMCAFGFFGFGFVVLGAVFGWLIPERKPYGFDHPNRILTAEVLLGTLEEKTDWWEREFRPTFLPKSELELVESELKSRFPIQSLRQRLSFQNSHPAPVVRQIVVREHYKGVQDGFFSQRARALADLHSEEVHEFINRAGQGLTRSPRPEPADLRLWDRYAKSLDSEPVDSMILGEQLVSLKGEFADGDFNFSDSDVKLSENGMPRKETVAIFHRSVEDGFAKANSLGYVENIDKTSGFESHQVRLLETWDGFLMSNTSVKDVGWKVNQIQLVSLLMHDQPGVYVTDQLPNMQELSGSNTPTRPLNDFESNSLKDIVAGEDIVASATTSRIVMLGSIRAETSCLECHAVKQNDLLGAFSYELIRKSQSSPSEQY